jgi:uracil-DNA glycosylase family 4
VREGPDLAPGARTLLEVDRLVEGCTACPRLVEFREKVSTERRAAFRDQTYWGRGVPSFGDEQAGVVVVGLAPAAHGSNRTGRMFTGDRSGQVLVAAMHRTGFASQPTAVSRDDGLVLTGARIVAPVHCVPPDNKPTPDERRRCSPYLGRELELLAPTVRVAVVLGGFGWVALLATLRDQGWSVPRPRPRFGHGAKVRIGHPDGRELTVLGCFHVSPHNTSTGRLTPQMVDDVLLEARRLAGLDLREG